MRRAFRARALAAVILAGLVFAGTGQAKELQPISLPNPQKTGGKPLMEALNARHTTREISEEKIPLQTLSNLLWAAFGVNRDKGPRGNVGRTAPSAMNFQEIDIYVALSGGVYVYDAVGNVLKPVSDQDVRAKVNGNPNVGKAPIVLIYVQNMNKTVKPQDKKGPAAGKGGPPPGPMPSFGEVDAGFIGQNVYLFAASEGLAAWFFMANREGLIKDLNLNRSQSVLFGQAVGRPAK